MSSREEAVFLPLCVCALMAESASGNPSRPAICRLSSYAYKAAAVGALVQRMLA